jgi:uncharacterized protein YabN with tetrapyrrole methylase and pyrophosphatase domain
MEQMAAKSEKSLQQMTLAEMDELWNKSKMIK